MKAWTGLEGHPRDQRVNAEAKARFQDRWAYRHRECGPDCCITGDRCEDDNFEAKWLWEELGQMTAAHGWAIDETHRLGKELLEARAERDLWKQEAEAAQVALTELRALIPKGMR